MIPKTNQLQERFQGHGTFSNVPIHHPDKVSTIRLFGYKFGSIEHHYDANIRWLSSRFHEYVVHILCDLPKNREPQPSLLQSNNVGNLFSLLNLLDNINRHTTSKTCTEITQPLQKNI